MIYMFIYLHLFSKKIATLKIYIEYICFLFSYQSVSLGWEKKRQTYLKYISKLATFLKQTYIYTCIYYTCIYVYASLEIYFKYIYLFFIYVYS